MPISYVSDSDSDTMAVQIPIDECCELIEKLPEIEIGRQAFDIPRWQKEEVLRRKKYYDENEDELLSWEDARERLKL